MNISGLKNILRSELSLYNEKRRQYEDAVYQKDLLEELNALINVSSINELHSNMLGISIILPLIYGEQESKILENKMYNIIFRIENYYKNKALEKEFLEEEKNLKILLNRFFADFEIIQGKISTYAKELKERFRGQKYCRKILYRFNHNYIISNDLISYIKNILQERGYSQEQIIVTLEFLAHHNQRVKYNSPKISFTTIKMVESDYHPFELDEFQDREKKAKLDSFCYSAFETLIEEENHKSAIEFLEEMTTWMSESEFEYAMKCLMNKFLEVLQTCKNDMLDENNYEDDEIKKFIIDEFNTYYHIFKNVENYYYEKTKKEVVKEEIEIGGGIESLPTKENNFVFASGVSKSFVERDIEDVPEEYFDRVKFLLEEFKKNTLSEKHIEGFVGNSKLKGFFKLKDDQIRIIFRPLNKDTYYFLGVLVKKDDDANREYIRIISRNRNIDISDHEVREYLLSDGEEIYSNFITYLETNSRKGNR